MMKKGCELCSSQAKMYCESDQASLCWDCDDKVHGANFLVAKHMRTVLCHVCQSQTPWKAAGLKLGRTVSICDGCVRSRSGDGGGVRKIDPHEEKEEIREEVAQSRAVGNTGGNERDVLEDGFDDDEEDEDDFEDDSYSDDDFDDCDDEIDENQVVPWTSSPPLNTASTASWLCRIEADA